MPLVLTITVSKLEDDVQYVLYKYDDEERVPTSQFNYHSKWAKNAWKFIGTAGKGILCLQPYILEDLYIITSNKMHIICRFCRLYSFGKYNVEPEMYLSRGSR